MHRCYWPTKDDGYIAILGEWKDYDNPFIVKIKKKYNMVDKNNYKILFYSLFALMTTMIFL